MSITNTKDATLLYVPVNLLLYNCKELSLFVNNPIFVGIVPNQIYRLLRFSNTGTSTYTNQTSYWNVIVSWLMMLTTPY